MPRLPRLIVFIKYLYIKSMKITVELSEDDLRDVLKFSGETKKGPAIRKFIARELMLLRRREISRRVLTGECSATLPPLRQLRKERKIWRKVRGRGCRPVQS